MIYNKIMRFFLIETSREIIIFINQIRNWSQITGIIYEKHSSIKNQTHMKSVFKIVYVFVIAIMLY